MTAFRTSGLLAPIYNDLFNINIPNILIVDPGKETSNSLLDNYSAFLSVFVSKHNNQANLTKGEIKKVLKHSYYNV